MPPKPWTVSNTANMDAFAKFDPAAEALFCSPSFQKSQYGEQIWAYPVSTAAEGRLSSMTTFHKLSAHTA